MNIKTCCWQAGRKWQRRFINPGIKGIVLCFPLIIFFSYIYISDNKTHTNKCIKTGNKSLTPKCSTRVFMFRLSLQNRSQLFAQLFHFPFKIQSVFISSHVWLTGASIMCHYWCRRRLGGTIRHSGEEQHQSPSPCPNLTAGLRLCAHCIINH